MGQLSAKDDVSKTAEDSIEGGRAGNSSPTAANPIVRTHPETGRKAIYTSEGTPRISRVERERRALPLDCRFLCGTQTRPEFTCRFGGRRLPGVLGQTA